MNSYHESFPELRLADPHKSFLYKNFDWQSNFLLSTLNRYPFKEKAPNRRDWAANARKK
jgi:hypothetical protein